MTSHPSSADAAAPTEGTLREQLASFFLSMPSFYEQTTRERQAYLQQLNRLGELERQEILRSAGAARPLVWGNPAPLLQSLLAAAQRLGAGLGQPILLFPAKGTAIGWDTLLHPRVLSVALESLLCCACLSAPKQPIWVRMQEHRDSLSVTVVANAPITDEETLALIKECTRLHDGRLVHHENTIQFSLGCIQTPPPGIRLYCCPSEQDLLQDTLSPVWSCFYAGVYSAILSSSPEDSCSD